MSWRSIRLATLVILGLALIVVPGLVGCGSSKGENRVITIGVLADFSGAASSAVVPCVDAFEEAIIYYQEQDPIKGITFEFSHFDHQLNYAKAVDGYNYLKAQGMDFFYCMGGTEQDMLASFIADDHMPTIGSYGTIKKLAVPYIYELTPNQTYGSEATMKWIAETWDYSKGTPKIGHQGWMLSTTDEIQWGIDNVRNDAAYAGKFDWVGADKATMTNAAWSASYAKFKDCDWIFVSTVGNSLATFVSQMRSLGYKGAFISGCNQFPGYFTQVAKATAAANLYGMYYCWWGPTQNSDDPADWFQEMLAQTQARHSDSATRLAGTSPISGFATGRVAYEYISAAVKAVGADKVDGDAINEAFLTTQIDLEGTGNTFTITETNHSGLWTHKIVKWNVDTLKWEPTNGKWYDPLVVPA